MGLLDGRVAIVTGSGRGIGREFAMCMAQEGAQVVVNDVGVGLDGRGTDEDLARRSARRSRRSAARRPRATTRSGLRRRREDRPDRGRRLRQLDILVNNAGIVRDRTL